MPGQNLIDLGYDMDKITPQQKVMVEYLSQVLDLAEQLDRKKIAPSIGGQAEFNDALGKQKKIVDDLSLSTDQYNKILSGIATTQAKTSAASSTAAENYAIEKEQLNKRNAELQNAAKYLTAESNSLEEARAKVKLLTAERDKLNLATAEGKAKQAELNQQIDLNNNFIKGNVSQLEKQKINIGNYAGSFKEAFAVLQSELQGVRNQLTNLKPGDAGFDKLSQEEKLLATITENLNRAFSSTKQELRAFSEATKQMGLSFGMADEKFQAFVEAVGSQKNEIEDIQKTINFQASDTKYIDGMISAVRGMAGAYAAAQAGAVLLAGDDEKLQKEMARMQALLTLITGLQQFFNEIQTESGAIQLALEVKTKLLNAAKTIEGVLFTKTATAVELDTAAKEVNEAVTSAQAEANIANAESAGVAGVAMEGLAVGTEGATAATIGLRTAIISTGIGALIVGIIWGITKLVGVVYDWVKADDIAATSQRKLTEAMNDLLDTIKEQDSSFIASSQKKIDALNRISEKQKALGQTDAQTHANELKIAEEKKKIYQELAATHGKSIDQIRVGITKEQKAYDDGLAAIESFQERTRGEQDKDRIEKNKKAVDDAKKKVEAHKKEVDILTTIDTGYTQSQQEEEVKKNEIAKMGSDDQRKIALESKQLESDFIQAKNAIILGDERSTLNQRLAAMRSNAAEQKKIAAAELNDVKNNPSSSGADRLIAEKKYNESVHKLNLDERENERKEKDTWRKRELAAIKAFDDTLLNEDISNNTRISENTTASLEDRLAAFQKVSAAQKKLIDDDYEYQKKTRVLTKAESEALEVDHEAKLVALRANGTAKIIQITQSAYDQLKQISDDYFTGIANKNEEFNAIELASTEKKYADDVLALNASFQKGIIGVTKYNRDRKKLDDEHNKQSLLDTQKYLTAQQELLKKQQEQDEKNRQLLQSRITDLSGKSDRTSEEDIQLKSLQRQLQNYKDHAKDLAAIDTQIYKNKKELTDADTSKVLDAKNQRSSLEKSLADETLNLTQQLIDGGYERELNEIQKIKDADDERYSTQLQNIQASSLSEQDKAAKTAEVEATQRANDKKLDREARDVKNRQAKADRVFTIANIVSNTAMAEVQALTYLSNPLTAALYPGIAALIATMGAVELATVLAKPIPQYAFGIEDHPGGLAVVGEGSKKELVETPAGDSFIADKAMLLDLPKGTTVTPFADDDLNTVMYNSMIRKTGQMLSMQDAIDRRKSQAGEALAKKQISLLEKLVAKDQTVRIRNENKIDLGYTEYINNQVFHRKA